MANNSASGGFLAPAASPAPLEGVALQDFLQSVVVGVTGLAGANVRPRWQAEPPNLPAITTNWAAIGEQRRHKETFAAVLHDATDAGQDLLVRHQELYILVSFYGPGADHYADVLADGLQIAQNRATLRAQAFDLVETGELTTVPELIKDRWYYRTDLPITFRRRVERRYDVLNLLDADVQINEAAVPDPAEQPVVGQDGVVVGP